MNSDYNNDPINTVSWNDGVINISTPILIDKKLLKDYLESAHDFTDEGLTCMKSVDELYKDIISLDCKLERKSKEKIKLILKNKFEIVEI